MSAEISFTVADALRVLLVYVPAALGYVLMALVALEYRARRRHGK